MITVNLSILPNVNGHKYIYITYNSLPYLIMQWSSLHYSYIYEPAFSTYKLLGGASTLDSFHVSHRFAKYHRTTTRLKISAMYEGIMESGLYNIFIPIPGTWV